MHPRRGSVLIAGVSLVVLSLSGTASLGSETKQAHETAQSDKLHAASSDKPSQKSELPKVMEPDAFVGKTKAAYILAQKYPHIAKDLFCYCGCDITDDHTSLLSCFIDGHAADCIECKGEIIMAAAGAKRNRPTATIAATIHKKWGTRYPFKQPSNNYRKFLKKWNLPFLHKSDALEPTDYKPDCCK